MKVQVEYKGVVFVLTEENIQDMLGVLICMKDYSDSRIEQQHAKNIIEDIENNKLS